MLNPKRKNLLILIAVASAVLVTPVAASAAFDYLNIKVAIVDTNKQRVTNGQFTTEAFIPQNGQGGAFGYGIITGEGTVIVSTTHAGVLDSKLQDGNKNSPIFHNHYVTLIGDATHCGTTNGVANPAVDKITFKSPGNILVAGNTILLSNLPKTSEGISQNSDIHQGVVSFKLNPIKNAQGQLQAVCVTDIQPAKKVVQT
jgi:hypothetical protein